MKSYPYLYPIFRAVMFLWHPVFRVKGREHLTPGQHYVICCNHSGMMDPAWLLFALRANRQSPCIMAKESVMKVPVIGAILRKVGVFGVRRGENDVQAVKHALAVLKDGRSLMLFPEGTRVKPGKTVTPKTGAMLFATRTQTPILPIYLQTKRHPFSPLHCVIGEPYLPHTAERRATSEELHRLTEEMMKKIYELGEGI